MQNLNNTIIEYLTLTLDFIKLDSSGPILITLFFVVIFIYLLLKFLDITFLYSSEHINNLFPNFKLFRPITIKRKYLKHLFNLNEVIHLLNELYPGCKFYYLNDYLYYRYELIVECSEKVIITIRLYNTYFKGTKKFDVFIPYLGLYKYGINFSNIQNVLYESIVDEDIDVNEEEPLVLKEDNDTKYKVDHKQKQSLNIIKKALEKFKKTKQKVT